MRFAAIIPDILFQPSKFFTKLKSERGFADSLTFLAVWLLFSIVLSTLMGYVLMPFTNELVMELFGEEAAQEPVPWEWAFAIGLGYPMGLFLSFVSAALLHVWILIFGGRANYEKSYQLYIYSRTPDMLFGWIPVVSFFTWIYSLYLLIVGTQKVHGIKRTTAILMYIIPMAILLAVSIFLVVIALLYPGAFVGPADVLLG